MNIPVEVTTYEKKQNPRGSGYERGDVEETYQGRLVSITADHREHCTVIYNIVREDGKLVTVFPGDYVDVVEIRAE